MSVDPLADVPHSIGLSPYHFVANNPINNIDPDGRDWYTNNESGKTHWQEGSGDLDRHKNIGANYTINGENQTIVHEQNEVVSVTDNISDNQSSVAETPLSVGTVASLSGTAATGTGAFNVSGGDFRGRSGSYYSIEGRGGWNQYTGTKAKMNARISTAKIATRLSRGLGVINAGISTNQWMNEDLSNTSFGIELLSTGISSLAKDPRISIPWTIGYEGLGRNGITRLNWYQSLKRRVQGVEGGSDGLISTER